MTIASARPVDNVRRRPKDRKAQIARASAEAFSAQGYHAVSMETIAAKVGVSAPALYRHYAGKYDLFRGAVLSLSQQLVDAVELVNVNDAVDPTEELDRLVVALIDLALDSRESGGLYRWQSRYLRAEDQAVLAAQLISVNRRIQQPLLAVRPTLTSEQRWTLSAGVLSAIGSIVDHRSRLPAAEIRALLKGAAAGILSAELPQPGTVSPRPVSWRLFTEDAGVYEALLHAAMALFKERGYTETSMAQIAAAAGIPVSGIYRYFSGKLDILSTGLRRAADRVSAQLSPILGALTEPRQALTLLIDAYVATSFANPELLAVYYTERMNLTPADQMVLRNVLLSTVDSWVQLLTAARPALSPMQARFLVHAAMALVVDLGRMLTDKGDSAYMQACVRTLMEVTLFGPTTTEAPPPPPEQEHRESSSPNRVARRRSRRLR
ncbi:TetR family transcriptional regulator [Mycobacterium intermedium]|uniref:TetR family transcriptional regulator n=1 Tax=Mycobacterium intermedium TaxID=28445 RepID=A0A1E3S686_MYCIE|nr:TetR/AcrR family transcriptional regulator [Mycobacterium intermedium]MCV6962671.1 TetR/AcrR family transcriptional regulator [Mycobacterium intermedium]ODQ97693.1 TetR family transcriptional regulator [Mycobacterium intermedium]OPE47874.1 TetR family transcriptional regulator [Mycobacterium intermedium]ORA96680.1 TetR family transcriptional regulator [Mycobacterium intermedium]